MHQVGHRVFFFINFCGVIRAEINRRTRVYSVPSILPIEGKGEVINLSLQIRLAVFNDSSTSMYGLV